MLDNVEDYARIRVVGVGGGGSNAVDRMIEAGVMGVEYVAVNTDLQVLDLSAADKKLQIGEKLTGGLGTGGDPDIGRQAGEESRQEILMSLDDSDMVFITAGMGGGTGTGASPIIAEIAREMDALTVGIVTKPFAVEGHRRAEVAEEGLKRLKEQVDALIVIPNDRLIELSGEELTLREAFALADQILHQGVRGISEVIVVPGLINLDFADVRAVMKGAGTAMMSIGEASGDCRAAEAANLAIDSPLLETNIKGATALLVNITGGPDLSLKEVHEAARLIQEAAQGEGDNADMTLGAVIDEQLEGSLRLTVVATGFDEGPSRRSSARRWATDVKEGSGESQEGTAQQAFQEEMPTYDENDLDIPAFLRRH